MVSNWSSSLCSGVSHYLPSFCLYTCIHVCSVSVCQILNMLFVTTFPLCGFIKNCLPSSLSSVCLEHGNP